MRKQKLFLGLVLFLFGGSLFAQSGWQWQNPSLTGHDINCIQKINNNLIVGYGYGCFLKSTNNGETWIYKELDSIGGVKSIKYFNESTGYLLRDNNTLSKTTNGGNNWKVILSDSSSINLVKFTNINYGLAAVQGKYIYKTTNGGNSWFLLMTAPRIIQDIYSPNETVVKCLNTSYGSIGGMVSNKVFQTVNGGTNWTEIDVGNLTSYTFNSICFIDSLHGFIGGDGDFFFETNNGGGSWSRRNLNFTYDYKKIEFINSLTGYVLSRHHYSNPFSLLLTTNGGVTWKNIDTLQGWGVCLLDSLNIISIGSSGILYKSTNYGSTWINKDTAYFRNKLFTVQCVSDNVYYAAGLGNSGHGGAIVKTTNGGASWFQQVSQYEEYFTSLYFINENTGTAITSRNVLRTTNGGTNWSQQYQHPSPGALKSVFFLNKDTGFAAASYGNVNLIRTFNGGLNWTEVTDVPPGAYESIHFVNNSVGFLASTDSSMFKTTNSGMNWFELPGSPSGYKVYFLDESTGFLLLGDVGNKMSRTTNGGTNWTEIFFSAGDVLKAMTFINENTGFAAGSYSLLKTTNRGENWSQLPRSDKVFQYLSSYNNYAVLVGDGGLIKSTKPGQSIFINPNTNTNILSDFSLSQNYPNPFNPSTRINYELKITNYVTLKVFDLLGKEVASLVNEKQNAGSYTVDFNSSEFNLPSGIYFYTLNAGDFKETRKMVLIK